MKIILFIIFIGIGFTRDGRAQTGEGPAEPPTSPQAAPIAEPVAPPPVISAPQPPPPQQPQGGANIGIQAAPPPSGPAEPGEKKPDQSQVITVVPEGKTMKAPGGLPLEEGRIPELLSGIIEDYNYNPAGKRDPFTPFEQTTSTGSLGPIWPLQKYDLEQLKLVGIIWDVKIPKAMITDPTGKGYVVTVNERIGRNNGYIARIRDGEIVVVENAVGSDGKMTYVTKLMKLHPQ